jgi:hypothetical protein
MPASVLRAISGERGVADRVLLHGDGLVVVERIGQPRR